MSEEDRDEGKGDDKRERNIYWFQDYNAISGGSDGKESACNPGEPGFNPQVGMIPWRRERLPTPVFLPGEFHGQRNLVAYSPWGCKESDITE